MEDNKCLIVLVIGILIISVLVMFGMNKHNEIMADKGFCKTTIVGTDTPVWGKCK